MNFGSQRISETVATIFVSLYRGGAFVAAGVEDGFLLGLVLWLVLGLAVLLILCGFVVLFIVFKTKTTLYKDFLLQLHKYLELKYGS